MQPILVSRILIVLFVINEVIVVVTSKPGTLKGLKIPLYATISEVLILAPFFYAVPYPEWLGWGLVALQAAGLALEMLAEFQLVRAQSFAVSSGGATQVQHGGMYRFLENPIYVGILMQIVVWAVWMPLALVPVVLLFPVVRSMVAGEREYLSAQYGASHRGIDSFLWN